MTGPAYGQVGTALVAGFGAMLASERPASGPSVRYHGARPGATPAPSPFEPLTRSCAGPGDPDRPACETSDPDLFFPVETRSKEGKAQVEQARRVCRACPRLVACREDAIDQDERHAIRGGLTPAQVRAYNLKRAS